jgi:DNA-binding CsgD family transcriptional regulator
MLPVEMNQRLSNLMGDKLTRFCQPLVDMLDVSQFYHYVMTRQGHIAAVGLHTELQEYLVSSSEWHDFTPYVYHNMDNLNGVVFTQALPNDDWKRNYDYAAQKFDVHLSLQVSQKTAFGIEGFGFGLKTANPSQHLAFLNHLPLLRIFISEYKKTLNTNLLHEHLVDAASLTGPDFFDASKAGTMGFKNVLLGKMMVKSVNPLSPRESEIADLLLQGYSAFQIGEILFRSNRTIESHIERIKDKLDCSRRSDLIQKLGELKSMGC